MCFEGRLRSAGSLVSDAWSTILPFPQRPLRRWARVTAFSPFPRRQCLKICCSKNAVFHLPTDQWALAKAAAGCWFGKEVCVRKQGFPAFAFHDCEPGSEHDLVQLRETEGTTIGAFQVQGERRSERAMRVRERLIPFLKFGLPRSKEMERSLSCLKHRMVTLLILVIREDPGSGR